jgi:17beta-estradiol 17-dehydrogenase / very-long-chain 3-oxoacyl-CoA reductase
MTMTMTMMTMTITMSMPMTMMIIFLAACGALAIIYVLIYLTSFIYRLVCPIRIDIKKFGGWALITGSTDGIGKAYAIELAKRGRDIN